MNCWGALIIGWTGACVTYGLAFTIMYLLKTNTQGDRK